MSPCPCRATVFWLTCADVQPARPVPGWRPREAPEAGTPGPHQTGASCGPLPLRGQHAACPRVPLTISLPRCLLSASRSGAAPEREFRLLKALQQPSIVAQHEARASTDIRTAAVTSLLFPSRMRELVLQVPRDVVSRTGYAFENLTARNPLTFCRHDRLVRAAAFAGAQFRDPCIQDATKRSAWRCKLHTFPSPVLTAGVDGLPPLDWGTARAAIFLRSALVCLG